MSAEAAKVSKNGLANPVTTTSAPATIGATLREALEELGARGAHRATVEGVDVDLATTLVTLHGAMRGSDQFLHVCVWM